MANLTQKKIQYFTDFDHDLVKLSDQDYQLASDYRWIRQSRSERFLSAMLSSLAKVFAYGFNKFYLKQSFVNLEVIKPYRKKGFFLYVNHTQPLGDPFLPMLVGGAIRYHVVCSPANLGLKILGPLLPYGGALPIPQDLHQLPKLINAIKFYLQKGDFITIYPEAHVWPYYTKIRPFSKAAFHFPVIMDAPTFVMTNTYQKDKHFKKPKMVSYIDGPFFVDRSLSKNKQQELLRNQVHQTMEKRAKKSNIEYVKYIKREDE